MPNLPLFNPFAPPLPAIFRTSPKTKHCDADDFLDIHASPPTFNSIHNSKLLQALTAATSAWQTPRNKRAQRWTREPADRSGLGAKAGRRRRGWSTTRGVTRRRRQLPRGLTALGQTTASPPRCFHPRSQSRAARTHARNIRNSSGLLCTFSPDHQTPPLLPKHTMSPRDHGRASGRHAARRCILDPAAMAKINCLFSLPYKASACCKRPIFTETSEVAVLLSQILGSRPKPLSRTVAWQPHCFETALKVWRLDSGRVWAYSQRSVCRVLTTWRRLHLGTHLSTCNCILAAFSVPHRSSSSSGGTNAKPQ